MTGAMDSTTTGAMDSAMNDSAMIGTMTGAMDSGMTSKMKNTEELISTGPIVSENDISKLMLSSDEESDKESDNESDNESSDEESEIGSDIGSDIGPSIGSDIGSEDIKGDSKIIDLDEKDYSKMTVAQLKDILIDMDLPFSGNKTKLIQRIKDNKK